MSRILTHFSAEPLQFDSTRKYDQGEFGNGKPAGLWLSDESDLGWKEWCETENWGTDTLQHASEFIFDPSAEILHLDTLEKVREFGKNFRGHPKLEGTTMAGKWIDWPRAAREYDGILITPYQWPARLPLETSWYYGWDCASACVWNPETLVLISQKELQPSTEPT